MTSWLPFIIIMKRARLPLLEDRKAKMKRARSPYLTSSPYSPVWWNNYTINTKDQSSFMAWVYWGIWFCVCTWTWTDPDFAPEPKPETESAPEPEPESEPGPESET